VVEFYSNLSANYTELCAQTFGLTVGLFLIIDRNLAKMVAPTSNKNENYLLHLKG